MTGPFLNRDDNEEEDVRHRRRCAQLLGVAVEAAEATLAPIVGSMYVRSHFPSDTWLKSQERKKESSLLLHWDGLPKQKFSIVACSSTYRTSSSACVRG